MTLNELQLLCQQLSPQQAIKEVLSYLHNDEVILYWQQNHLYCQLSDEELSNHYHTTSLISVSKDIHNRKDDALMKLIERREEKAMVYQKIVSAINHIALGQDRQLFYRRYICKETISGIMKAMSLSQNGYYQGLQRACQQFCAYLNIRN